MSEVDTYYSTILEYYAAKEIMALEEWDKADVSMVEDFIEEFDALKLSEGTIDLLDTAWDWCFDKGKYDAFEFSAMRVAFGYVINGHI